MRIFFFLSLVFCQVGVVAATEGPRAFFGFVTHYERTSSGRGEVLVLQIVPGGPAQRAGLAPGDRIVAFNNVAFDFADEYQYMCSLGVFESGRKLVLTVDRGGREFKVELVPENLSPQQVEAVAGYMAQLAGCMETGRNCPCSVHHPGSKDDVDFRSPYRRFTDSIPQHGGTTVLTVARDGEGRLHYSSAPVPLPPGFEITADEDGILWPNIEALGKGKSLAVEISSTGPGGSRRVRILTP
jgi:hypothetical protein